MKRSYAPEIANAETEVRGRGLRACCTTFSIQTATRGGKHHANQVGEVVYETRNE
jgi:hypothetical protein